MCNNNESNNTNNISSTTFGQDLGGGAVCQAQDTDAPEAGRSAEAPLLLLRGFLSRSRIVKDSSLGVE